MTTVSPLLASFAAPSANAAQFQPYPYNTATAGAAIFAAEPFSSAPSGPAQNLLPELEAARGPLRFGDRKTPGGRRRKQKPPPRQQQQRSRPLPPGPVSARADGAPVVPIYSYTTVQNGTYVQVPLFWTALSIALGYEVRGDEVIRGLPCIKRLYQLFCRNPGTLYPGDRIDSFITDNRALMRRMFGEFQPPPDFNQQTVSRQRRDARLFPHSHEPAGSAGNSTVGAIPPHPLESHAARRRSKRQSSVPPPPAIDKGSKNLEDSCESKVEIITPYWASNSAGDIRAIVNTDHFPQAIHQEICKTSSTPRCNGECVCEQKYTYHRLLAYDPENDCKGIFIDWFLFPSCCACRCPP